MGRGTAQIFFPQKVYKLPTVYEKVLNITNHQGNALNLDWLFFSYVILYMFQCHSPKSSHPHPHPQRSKRLFYASVSLLLSRIQGYHYHLSKFHAVLITVAVQYIWKSEKIITSVLFFLKITLAMCGLLSFHRNFMIVCSISVKKCHQNSDSGCIESVDCLG